MAFYTFVTAYLQDLEYRFVTIVCKFQHSTSDFYFTSFHFGAVTVNVHIQVWIFIVQVLKFTSTCSQVLLLFYLHRTISFNQKQIDTTNYSMQNTHPDFAELDVFLGQHTLLKIISENNHNHIPTPKPNP